jgi:serine O-acetyltransferase
MCPKNEDLPQPLITTISSKMLSSYDKLGLINTGQSSQFPSIQTIQTILVQLKEILFPGFLGITSLTDTPTMTSLIQSHIHDLHNTLKTAIINCLKWDQPNIDAIGKSSTVLDTFLSALPELRERLIKDATAILKGDPAATSLVEIVLSYPGFQAIMVHRIAHILYNLKVPLMPRMMTEIVHSDTGIDIHPGAIIGESFCIDHGTGIVIGETAIIGHHVKLYQGVTLGAFSVNKLKTNQKRHPTLKNHITVYARSTILGGDTIIGDHCIIGGNVWLVDSMPDNTTIYVSMSDRQVIKPRKPI